MFVSVPCINPCILKNVLEIKRKNELLHCIEHMSNFSFGNSITIQSKDFSVSDLYYKSIVYPV